MVFDSCLSGGCGVVLGEEKSEKGFELFFSR